MKELKKQGEKLLEQGEKEYTKAKIDEDKIGEVNSVMQEAKSLDFCYDEDVSLYNSVMRFDNETRDSVLDLKEAINFASYFSIKHR